MAEKLKEQLAYIPSFKIQNNTIKCGLKKIYICILELSEDTYLKLHKECFL